MRWSAMDLPRLKRSRIAVTGGTGFLGRVVVARLEAEGCKVSAPPSREYGLVDPAAVRRFLKDLAPEVVIHLAARVGGIGANRANPGSYFYENLMMGVQLLHESWKAGVAKVLAVGTICAYPKDAPVPFREED